MIQQWIDRWGLFRTTVIVTVIADLGSFILYLTFSLPFGNISWPGAFRSIVIPSIIAPILSCFFVRFMIRLDASRRALRESEEKYRTILDGIEDGYYEVDRTGDLTFFNDALCRILGYPASELFGMNYRGFMDTKNAQKVFETFNHVFTTGEPSRGFDWVTVKKNGTNCHLDASVSLIVDSSGKPTGFRGIARDRTAARQAEKTLRESEEKYRQLVNYAPAGICEIDLTTGKLVSTNDVFSEYTGYRKDELVGMPVSELLNDESRKLFDERLKRLLRHETIPASVEYRVRAKDGHEFWALLNVRYVYEADQAVAATVVVHDITERKQAEEEKKRLADQLRQSQKMEALGTLAGGIAHDFNNILSAINGNTEIALLKAPEDSPLKENLFKIVSACDRARDIVRQILSFSRRGQPKRHSINPEEVVSETVKMLSASLPATIEIETEIDSAVKTAIEADDTQVQQVLMNICTNAAHAMREKGGVLKLGLTRTQIDEKDAARLPDLRPGPFLKLDIADTGPGIPPDIMDRIFDPYFTTKPDGTGLGLSMVQSIIRAHNGAVTVESVEGRGSTFCVYLPWIEYDSCKPESLPVSMQRLEGSEQILFIDDEAEIADVGRQSLELLGYHVETRTNASEALALFQSDPRRFDLIITDMTMPGLTGDRLAIKLKEIRKDIPVILCTGYHQSISREQAEDLGIEGFIMKPYKIEKLVGMIRQLIDKSAPADLYG